MHVDPHTPIVIYAYSWRGYDHPLTGEFILALFCVTNQGVIIAPPFLRALLRINHAKCIENL